MDEVSRARTRRHRTTASPLIGEVVDALLTLGSAAHRDQVIDRIARRRGAPFASDGLRREVVEAFNLHIAQTRSEGRPPLFNIPFGEGSRRWRLSHDAQRFLKARGADGEVP